MMHLILVIAIVIILAASYLLTFALCRAATRRDMSSPATDPSAGRLPAALSQLRRPKAACAS